MKVKELIQKLNKYDKEKAENRFVELVKTNQYKKDRAIKSAKYNEDIGAYRIEEHEIENETSEAMSEEEKKAIEFIKNLIAWDVRQDLCPNKEECENLETILNLIEKLQKENEKYKRLSEMNLKNAEEFKNNMCEHRCLLKSENEELQRENEELKKFITEGITVAPHSTYKNYRLDFLRENFVSKKKIKNKIEELSKTKGDLATHIAVSERIRALQEILEESEDSKDGEN